MFVINYILRDKVLLGLNVTSQGLAHYEILRRSALRCLAEEIELSAIMNKLVSSVNKNIFHLWYHF